MKNVGSLICVDAAMTWVVWHTGKPHWYYAEITWTFFGAETLQRLIECWVMQRNWWSEPGRKEEKYHRLPSQLGWWYMKWEWGWKFICCRNYCQTGRMAGTTFNSTRSGSCERQRQAYNQPQVLFIPVVTPLRFIAQVYFTCMRGRCSPHSWRGLPKVWRRGRWRIQNGTNP